MVGSECKVGLGEFSYEFYCKIGYLTFQDGLILGGFLFPSVRFGRARVFC